MSHWRGSDILTVIRSSV